MVLIAKLFVSANSDCILSCAGAEETVRVEGNELRIAQGPGWVFGDVALLFNSPRTASVVAATDVVLWALDRATFLRFVMKHAQGAHTLRFVRKVRCCPCILTS